MAGNLSQLSLALPANFGASLHNAVAKEHDSSQTEHVQSFKKDSSHNNSYINHEAAEPNEIIVVSGSCTPAPVTQSLHSLGIASTRQPALP